MSIREDIGAGFASPDRRYGVYPIIHGGSARPELAEVYDRGGFAGIVGNVSYGAGFPDDAGEWKRTSDGLRAYIERGMHVWLYDESGYPSGTAGGYVTEHHPEFVACGLYCYDYWRPVNGPSVFRADVPGDRLWRAVLLPFSEGESDPIDVTDCLNENNVLYVKVPAGKYYLFMMSIRRLFDGTHATESYCAPRNYISLSDRAATEEFIRVTHENYRKCVGDEFGRGVLAMFTDEPSLISWNIRTGVFPILPWHESYPGKFKEKYGYDFMLACVAVVTRKCRNVVRRRCDFWEFIADTVAEGFFIPIREWCHKNGLKSSGHLLEEERLQAHVYNYGSFYRSMKQLDWPGIDQLNCEPASLMREGAIPIARFIASFADISGEHEVFTEFSDHCVRERGGTAGKICYYGSVNWHLAMGVNNFTSYYSFAGFTDEDKRAFNVYTARCGYLLRKGARDSRTAIFYPEAAMWASYTPSTKARAIDDSPSTLALDRSFTRASWELLRRQADFDYIDRELLVGGEVTDGSLTFGNRRYSTIVVPDARVLEDDAAERLLGLADAGCDVFFVENAPELSRETGERSRYADRIAEYIADGRMKKASTDGFGGLLDSFFRGRAVLTEKYEPMLLSHSRVTEDGLRIVFLANMAETDFSGSVSVPGEYGEVVSADARTGAITVLDAPSDGGAKVRVAIEPGGSIFLLLR